MSTETEITAQQSDYFGWVERELADAGLTGADGHGSHQRRHRRLALAAAAVLLVGGVATLLLRREPTQHVRPVAVSTTVTQSEAAGWQRSSGPPITERFQHISLATADGWFVWGGYSALSADPPGVALHDGAYFSTATGEWVVLPAAPFTADNPYVGRGVWTGAEVVITQGGPSPLVAAFDPVTFTWRTVPIPDEIRGVWQRTGGDYSNGWSAMLGDRIAVFFGQPSGWEGQASLLLLDSVRGEWAAAASHPAELQPQLMASSATHLFVVESGALDTVSKCLGRTSLHIYDSAADSWSVSEVPNGNWVPASAAWVGARLVLAGGVQCESSQPVRAAAAFDPMTGSWSVLANVPIDHVGFGASPSVVGGTMLTITEGRPLAYDSALDAWWYGPSLVPSGLSLTDDRMQMVVVDGRLVVLSPGWNPSPDSSMCCDSTGEVFSLPMPDQSAFGIASLPLTTTTTRPMPSFPAGTCTHVIEEGDSIASIADRFGITIDELVAANPGELNMVPGDVLAIPISPCPGAADG